MRRARRVRYPGQLPKQPRQKLTNDDYTAILEMLAAGGSIASIARGFNISTTRIWRLKNGELPASYVPKARVDQPVVGFRIWQFKTVLEQQSHWTDHLGIGYRLEAWSGYGPWNIGSPTEAVCSRGEHRAPQITCSCGFYLYKVLEEAEQHAPSGMPDSETIQLVGACLIWGRVIECQAGYRAEWAQPIALVNPRTFGHALAPTYGYPPVPNHRVEQAAKVLGVPLVSHDQLKTYASEFGLLLP